MRTLPALLSLLAMTALLAGCADGGAGSGAEEGPEFDDLGLQATDSTGLIRGVVVDDAIRPIAGAKVVLNGGEGETETTESGTFGFSNLAPGTYFLSVSKAGFFSSQQSADVVAGVAEPAIVKVLLQVDVENQPFFEAFVYEGFIECTTSVLVLCGAPNLLTGENLTNDRFTWNQYLTDGAEVIQSEMVWQSTQALSPQLYIEMEALESGCENDETYIAGIDGPSPLMIRIDNETIEEFGLGQSCPIYYSIFAGDASGGSAPVGAGATVQQRFTMYIHAFHGYTPSEEWRFSSGEPVPTP